ncbi:MAG: 3-carboxy-cis,cis-muconate cycloisomerase [Mesorhizobium sp.]|uniref:3-carboxy-cis,cis-muconate cycloisomerase n=1 Tax=Mesorhizobium sp. TaxID=1871066 RepID=UPI000FE9DCAB|nr:3-carboxy-cis,cis-muconate cycloisomerase [Mesorhizobium sp.]RWL17942.1 MAG: 3-carboxy-cis,cis-muconate cycloisomerase [Mesorhizobium sp.]
MAVWAFEHPFLSGLVGDGEVADMLGAEAEMVAMISFETALADAEAEHDVIPAVAARAIGDALGVFKPDMALLAASTARDGVVVPELVRQLREVAGKPYGEKLHFGATSQDVIDTALMLRLKPILEVLDRRITAISGQLEDLAERFGTKELTGHTRMQAAFPITVSDRIASWREPLVRHRARLAGLRKTALAVQFGGAAGTLEKLGDRGASVRATLAAKLGLADAPQWHSQRDRVADLANFLSLLTGSLGKFGQDIALLALAGDQIRLRGGGGSSAMLHKQNPVAAELLVTLARFNSLQLSGMHHALVHEQERSGSAWTLEWLVLPQMILSAGAATRIAAQLAGNIERLGR